MKYKAIIFDLDGTISNSEGIWMQATQEMISSRGVTLTEQLKNDLYKELNGLSLGKCIEVVKKVFKFSDKSEHLSEEIVRRVKELYQTNLTFIEGFEAFHQKTKKALLKTAVATNADDQTLYLTTLQLGLDRFFSNHIYGISCVNHIYKPNPAIYLYAAQQININPAECIAIEDSAHGIKAAKSAGMFCIGINTGRKKEFGQDADIIVDAYHKIDLDNLIS